MDYTTSRLLRYCKRYPRLMSLAEWLKAKFSLAKQYPSYMHPKLFALVIHTAYKQCIKRSISQMSPFVQNGDEFIQRLAMCSVQLYGAVESTGMHPTKWTPSLAAGLPHFATGHMRSWGRDVFIALKGLLLVTGRFQDAKALIMGFASVVKHGLVPNLLDSQRRPRYNARDATWWFTQAIQDYYNLAPDGKSILNEKVQRRFNSDDYCPVEEGYKKENTINEILQEILQKHASGIKFREWNAGTELDYVMTDRGFDIEIWTDKETGFVHGGNQWNAGTWMDKLGSSEKAGNRGKPTTPRDGAAIEIVALVYSTVSWLASLHEKKLRAESGVKGLPSN